MVGDFTMGGVTKEVTIPFRITDHSDTVAAEAHLVIDRTEYGVSWMRVMDDGSLFVGKEIDVVIYLLTRVGKPWPLEDEPEAPALQEPDGP